MSSDRSNARPVKPTLASTRTTRTPLAPRLAVNAAPPPRSVPTTTTARRAPAPTFEPPASTPRPRQPQVRQEETPIKDASGTANITPRSSARKSRVESTNSTPSQAGDSPNLLRPRISGNTTSTNGERGGGVGGLSVGNGLQGRMPNGRPKSMVSETGSYRGHTPMVRSPGQSDQSDLGSPPPDESIDSRFFHASDMSKQEPAPKKPNPKKAPTFFYADGRQGQQSDGSSRATSPGLSAVSEQRSTGPWARTESYASSARSGPLLSPSLNSLPSASPFVTAAPPKAVKSRSPSPNKDNIHLSYRKGVSQIFGSRPSPTHPQPLPGRPTTEPEPRRVSSESKSYQTPHRKTPSLSSIDSGSSHPPRRRSATTLDTAALAPSPLSLESKSATYPKLARPPSALSSIDPPSDPSPAPEGALSPTKTAPAGVSAPDARRERKVLDLEISNSSLLAINSSLEREVRRQKAELKRFRRLSRAGRFSVGPNDRSARLSEGLSTLGEEDEESDFDDDAPDFPNDDEDDEDEDEDEDSASASPDAQEAKHKDRLASDEKRLRVDLAKHKELLVQSQMMNQSLKRCTYTTETMIRDGRKALLYNVRVSDVRLGGRILTGHEEDEDVAGAGNAGSGAESDRQGLGMDIEAEDETLQGAESVDEQTRGFLDIWSGLGGVAGGVSASGVGGIWGGGGGSQRSFEGSEGGDRDSGIEVDKPAYRLAPDETVEPR